MVGFKFTRMVSEVEYDANPVAIFGQFAHDPLSNARVLRTGGHDGMLDVASIDKTSGFDTVAGLPVIVIVSPVLYPEPTAVAVILKTGAFAWYMMVNTAPVPDPVVVKLDTEVVPWVQSPAGSVFRIADKNAPPISRTVSTIVDVLAVEIVTVSPIA